MSDIIYYLALFLELDFIREIGIPLHSPIRTLCQKTSRNIIICFLDYAARIAEIKSLSASTASESLHILPYALRHPRFLSGIGLCATPAFAA
jgi:hypothetical protein